MFLQYGIKDGELVYIDQVERGILPDVTCPYCGGSLLARKGRVKAPHFAHAGETCREVTRDSAIVSLPAFDRFDLDLRGRDYDALKRWHNREYYTSKEYYRLQDLKLIEYNEWARTEQLTRLGKIPFGELPLKSFSQEQDRLIGNKHTYLMAHARTSWLSDVDRAIAETDLAIFRAQWRRVLSSTLYFLEIVHRDGKVYKIGITQRPIAQRVTEIKVSLTAQLWDIKITVLRLLQHRGAVELYFKLRYKAHQYPIGNLTEYFDFDERARKNALSDLTRLGDKELDYTESCILDGEEPPDWTARKA